MAAEILAEATELYDAVSIRLVRQLRRDDAELSSAERALRLAQTDYEIAGRKFAVQRDVTIRRVGLDPYRNGLHVTLHDDGGSEKIEFESLGRFRFIHMDIGDAAMIVLNEADEPMALEGLVLSLRRGGIGGTTATLTRSVNASLINKTGVGKTDDGKYFRKESEPDDDPF